MLTACGPSLGGDTGSQATASSGSGTGSASSAADGTTAVDSTGEPATGTSVDGSTTAAGTSSTGATATAADTTGDLVCVPACNEPWAECNNGEDDDGDGLADLEDPDCITPCHNGEEDTYHGVRFGQGECLEECYFDDNSGFGDDGCYANMICDPLGPKAWFGCEADPRSPVCNDQPIEQSEDCLVACLPMVPPGCDCFGCCTFPTARGPEDRWLGDPACTMADPTSCPPCTQNPSCIDLCDDPCEWCFGQPALPEGCLEATCEHGSPCTDHCDCEATSACLQGCCRPVAVVLQ